MSESTPDPVVQPKASVDERPFLPFGGRLDWRVWFGLIVSVLWLIMLAVYVSGQVGWSHVIETPMDAFGGFLEGAFAPLAFLWFVLAFFSQQKELAQNTTAIKMQYVEIQKSAEQAVIQSEAIRASEMHARKESFLRIADCDEDGMIRDSLLGSAHGYVYNRMIECRDHPPAGFTRGAYDFDPDTMD